MATMILCVPAISGTCGSLPVHRSAAGSLNDPAVMADQGASTNTDVYTVDNTTYAECLISANVTDITQLDSSMALPHGRSRKHRRHNGCYETLLEYATPGNVCILERAVTTSSIGDIWQANIATAVNAIPHGLGGH